jgi:hypothetical protein
MGLKNCEKVMPFVELKRRIAQDLVTPWCCRQYVHKHGNELFGNGNASPGSLPNNLLVRNDTVTPKKMAPISEVLGSNAHSHILIENIGKNDINCFFVLCVE